MPSDNVKGLLCDVEAEPLARYRQGGYHPVRLGDLFKNGRYRVIHKLGFGGYSTVWAARDEIANRNVALKIETSETFSTSRELEILQICSRSQNEPGSEYISKLLDAFRHDGPNGSHHCLILDILGSNVPAVLDEKFEGASLPREVATAVIKEVLCGLSYLHKQELAHGDIHTGNICFSAPSLAAATEGELLRILGSARIGEVYGQLEQSHTQGIPEYLVWPSHVPVTDVSTRTPIKIIDFGQSFTKSTKPRTLKTPLVLRPPEVLLDDDWDRHVDLWAAGCTIFELITGQPPFDSIMATNETLLQQMIESIGELPPMWQDKVPHDHSQKDTSTLQEWLEELVFDVDHPPEFRQEEVKEIGSLIGQLMRFNPSERISAGEAYRIWNSHFP
ncbi:serine protein kinase [Viridothelium virens]|uniref:non-specific serine/threonine protein kinase n=1 Tax=Viridothelium virens TaxID=1048519 RepID=A0A6A6HBG0_VIRVR|nr:serine protein kinase [Viridothelium virens]